MTTDQDRAERTAEQMTVAVTGADGMLGTNLLRTLLAEGYRIRAVLHPTRAATTIADMDVERIRADILEPGDLKEAFTGCSAVIHTAAVTDVWPSRSELLERVNVKGTANVIDACLAAAVERLVFVGTANSFGYGTKANPGDETRPFNAGRYGLGYIETKYRAYRMVLDAVRERNLPAVCVAPTFMIGAYDSKPGSGALIVALCRGEVPGCAPGGRNYVFVRDVTVGIVNALRRGVIGESYILGHENLSYKELFTRIANLLGKEPPKTVYPAFLVKAGGFFATLSARLIGKAPRLSYAMARVACDEHYYSANKAVRELGLPQTPIEEAVQEAHAWFRDNGYLDDPAAPGEKTSR